MHSELPVAAELVDVVVEFDEAIVIVSTKLDRDERRALRKRIRDGL
jgi:hypothetical protein